jgi:hypothetical protein
MQPVKPPRPTEPKKTFMNLMIVQSKAFILTAEIVAKLTLVNYCHKFFDTVAKSLGIK